MTTEKLDGGWLVTVLKKVEDWMGKIEIAQASGHINLTWQSDVLDRS